MEENFPEIPGQGRLSPKKKQLFYGFLGKIYEEEGDFLRAAGAYQQALKIAPDDLKIRTALARAYREAGKTGTAGREYEIILEQSARNLTDPDPSVRKQAIKTISSVPGPESDSLLLRALTDPDEVIRRKAALALGDRGNEAAIPVLLQLVEQSDPSGLTISRLCQLRVKEAIPAIVKRLSSSRIGMRRTAASSLGGMEDPDTLDALLPGLKDDNYLMRKTTAYALWQLHDTRAVPPLIEVLNDDASIVKKLAAYSLGKLGDSAAIEPLKILLEDTTDSNHLYAALALAELGEPVDTKIFLDELDAVDFFYRGTAIEGLEASGDLSAAQAIIPMLKDKTGWVRSIAAEALATLNLPESREALSESIKGGDHLVGAYAAAALWNMGDEAGEELLTRLMASPDTDDREFAARALKYVSDESRLPLLDKALDDPSLIVRRIAQESLEAEEKTVE